MKMGERIADAITAFSGSWIFIIAHAVWFALWLVAGMDINLLTLIVSLEAIFLATFVLMSQNRQAAKTQEQANRMEAMLNAIERMEEKSTT